MSKRPFAQQLDILTHAIPIPLALLAGALGLFVAIEQGHPIQVRIAMLGYGVAFALLYLLSTRYHLAVGTWREKLANNWDRFGIAVAIAASGLAHMEVLPAIVRGRELFGINAVLLGQVLLVAGVVFVFVNEVLYTGKLRWPTTLTYFVQAATISFAAPYDGSVLLSSPWIFVLAGVGAFAIGAVVFFALSKVPFHHAIWHLLVLAGNALHWCAMYLSIS